MTLSYSVELSATAVKERYTPKRKNKCISITEKCVKPNLLRVSD